MRWNAASGQPYLDAVHFPRPATRYWSEMHPEALKRGFQDFTSYYGMMLDSLNYGYVNGFAYTAPKPIAPEQAPERFQRAEEVFELLMGNEVAPRRDFIIDSADDFERDRIDA